jgi:membrane protein implicated in regulation of membrane protease activity
MKRYSPLWWMVVLPTSVVVGGSSFLLLGLLTDLGVAERIIAALILTFAADVAIATAIQVFAPTRVQIGPGERAFDSELPSETARVIGGFDGTTHGRVSVRGETWRATRAPDDASRLTTGMEVNVIARDGLTLLVSANAR